MNNQSPFRPAETNVAAVPRPPRLSEEIARLRDIFATRPLTLGEVVEVLQARAWTFVLMLLALPFITPIPLPFLSTPFGLAIALISLRLALGRRPWLPDGLLNRALPPGFFGMVLKGAGRVLGVLEKFFRPRLIWLATTPWLARMHAAAMLVAASFLLLPLPVPFSNAFPAWLILLVAGGLLERDGGAILAGYAVGAGGVAFFYFLGGAAMDAADAFTRWLAS